MARNIKKRKNTFLKILAIVSIVGYIGTAIASGFNLFGESDPTVFGLTVGQVVLNLTLILLGVALFVLGNIKSFFTFPKNGISSQEILMVVSIVVGGFAFFSGIISFFGDLGDLQTVVDIVKLGVSMVAIVIVGLQLFSKN